MINEIQKLQFELMRKATFNGFDGNVVVDSLEDKLHQELWEGVIMDREGYGHIDLIKLRDIQNGFWNIDTLFILCKKGKEKEVELLALRNWNADEVEVLSLEDTQKLMGIGSREDKRRIVRCWWD